MRRREISRSSAVVLALAAVLLGWLIIARPFAEPQPEPAWPQVCRTVMPEDLGR